MELKTRAIVMFARPYQITDSRTGEVNEGVSIQFYPSDDLTPFKDNETQGRKVIDDTVSYENLPKFSAVPGVYDLSVTMQSVKNARGQSKGQLKVTGVTFVSPLEAAPSKKAV